MVGIVERAALEVGRQQMGLVRHAVLVGERESRLASIGVGQPAQVVVERAVLHHQHDKRVDRQVPRAGKVNAGLLSSRLRDERARAEHCRETTGEAGRQRGALKELPPLQVLVGRLPREPLRVVRIADVAHGAEGNRSRASACQWLVMVRGAARDGGPALRFAPMRSVRGTTAAACVLLVAILAAPGAALARGAPRPHVRVALKSNSQRGILLSRRMTVTLAASRGIALVRPAKDGSIGVVATHIRDVRPGRRHARRFSLGLVSAGRRALAGCTLRRIVVSAAPIKQTGGAPARSVRRRRWLRTDISACRKHHGGGGTNSGTGPGRSGGSSGSSKPIAYPTSSDFGRCDFIDPADCLYPFPNDWFTTADSTTGTKRRAKFDILSMPKNVNGQPIDPSSWNRNDGFSPGEPIVTKVP